MSEQLNSPLLKPFVGTQSTPPLQEDKQNWPLYATGAVSGMYLLTLGHRGFRWDHLLMVLGYLALLALLPKLRRLALVIFPLLLSGMLYENVALLETFKGPIHVADLYQFELAWFGITNAVGELQIPAHYLDARPVPLLDLLCGLGYMIYLLEVFGIALLLYLKKNPLAHRVAWSFLVLNVIGISIWVLFPAAPPWYVQEHGLGPAVLDALPRPAGTARFDVLLGINYFHAFYARSQNVFGAMPSLHVGYPAMVAFATWPLGRRWRIATISFTLFLAFSAVYLNHHYILDALAGVFCAALAVAAVFAGQSQLKDRLGKVSLRPMETS